MLGHYVAALSEMKHACKMIVKPQENSSHRSMREDRPDSCMDPKDMDWIHLVQDSICFGVFVSVILIH
jgi:hypothetical protein